MTYRLFGLTVGSPLSLPAIPETGAPSDVDIEWATPAVRQPEAREAVIRPTATGFLASWPAVGVFEVDAQRVAVHRAPGADDDMLRTFLLGPVLALLLHQRGHLVLHASAVLVKGEAVAFLGDPGAGKSTMAAALWTQGHALIADDFIAIPMHRGVPLIEPGVPQLRLWPAATDALGIAPRDARALHRDTDKRAVHARTSFAMAPVLLVRIYVLTPGDATVVEALAPQEAIIELIRHSYGVRTLYGEGGAGHLRRCAKLAGDVSVRRLRVRRSLAALADVAALVVHDATSG